MDGSGVTGHSCLTGSESFQRLRQPRLALGEAYAIDEGELRTVGRRGPFDMRARNATIARAQRVQGVKGQSRDR